MSIDSGTYQKREMKTPSPPPGDKTGYSKDQVTVVVSRNVFSGHQKDYEEWTHRMVSTATEAPGSLGAVILVSGKGADGAHHIVFRFANEQYMKTWEDSYERQKLSHEADQFSTRSRQEATGMETWFAIPSNPCEPPPPQWKMAIVTFFAAYILTYIIIPRELQFLSSWPFPVLNILTNVLLASLMTWVMMPIFVRYIFRRWLYRQPKI